MMASNKNMAHCARVCLALTLFARNVIAAPSYDNPYSNPSSPSAGTGSDWGTLPVIPSNYVKVRIAHATLASVAWLFFFPLGAILIRTLETSRVVQIHYAVQMLGIYTFMAAAGMGIWMAKTVKVLDRYHPIIGMTLLGCLALQPATEILNHFLFRKHPRAIYLGYFHIWFGRLLITVGIIQGGLGFVFSASFPGASLNLSPRVAYGVVAIIVWILYISLAIVWPEVKQSFSWWRGSNNRRVEDEELRSRSLTDLVAPSAIHRPRRVSRQ